MTSIAAEIAKEVSMIRFEKALGLVMILASAVAACSSPDVAPTSDSDPGTTEGRTPASSLPPGSDTANRGGGTAERNDELKSVPDSGAPDGSKTTTPPSGPCAASADYDSCFTCCDPAGAIAAADQAFEACSCGAGGACASVCGASFCAGDKGNEACNTCLTNTCDVAGACTSPACQTANQCVKTNCAGKP
jgi:hypothetical protein